MALRKLGQVSWGGTRKPLAVCWDGALVTDSPVTSDSSYLHSSPARARPVAQVGKQVEKDPFKMQILLGFFNMGLAKKFVRVFSIPSHRRAHKLFGQPNNIIYRLSSTEQTMCPRNLSSLFNSEWEKMLLGKKVIKG